MTIHKWLVGLALAIIMIAALSVNAFLFSARSFQFNLAQVSPGSSGILMIDQLDEVSAKIDAERERTAGPRGQMQSLSEQISTLNATIADQQEQINTTMASLAQGVATLEGELGRSAGVEPAAALDAEQLEVRAASVIATPGMPAEHSMAASGIRQTAERLGQLQNNQDEARRDLQRLLGSQRLISTLVADSDNQIIAAKQTIVTRHEDFERVRSEAESLRRTTPWGIGTTLVGAHPTFTSTLLVLLMGALGAILYLFPAYMTRINPVTFAEIAMRMLFGMVTALAFYIVANATIAGLSFVPGQSAASNNAALLNPFTVGLVGIIAGIMADDIAAWIRGRGSEILGGRPGTPVAPTAAPRPEDVGFSGVNPHGGPPPV